jgi:hypothetical protein
MLDLGTHHKEIIFNAIFKEGAVPVRGLLQSRASLVDFPCQAFAALSNQIYRSCFLKRKKERLLFVALRPKKSMRV